AQPGWADTRTPAGNPDLGGPTWSASPEETGWAGGPAPVDRPASSAPGAQRAWSSATSGVGGTAGPGSGADPGWACTGGAAGPSSLGAIHWGSNPAPDGELDADGSAASASGAQQPW